MYSAINTFRLIIRPLAVGGCLANVWGRWIAACGIVIGMVQGPAAVFRLVGRLAFDVVAFLRRGLHARASLAAENLFLRKQLALYGDHGCRSTAARRV